MPDTQVNFSTIDPTTGQANAVFPGGIVIPTPTLPIGARSVRWIRESDGAQVAQISTFSGPPIGSRWEVEDPSDPTQGANVAMNVHPGTSIVSVFASNVLGAHSEVLLNSDNGSSFARTGSGTSAQKFTLFGGTLNGATGATGQTTGGFTSQRIGLGQYRITPTPNQTIMALTVSPVGAIATQVRAQVTAHGAFVDYCTVNDATMNFFDFNTEFIAIGVLI